MSIQSQINRIKTSVAAAYAAAGEKEATLPSSQTVSNLADTVRSIPSGVRLNFEVVGGTTTPPNPVTNTIWVYTDVAITSWEFSSVEPTSPAAGMVWIETGAASQSTQSFNALGEHTLRVYPISAKQYVGGAWVNLDVKQYIDGAWVDWWDGQLYILGNEYTAITGGWAVGNVPPPGWGNYKSATLTKNASNMVFEGRLNTLYTKKKINVTNYSTMVFKGSVNSWSTIRVKPTKDSQENGAYSDWSTGQTERRVDISGLTGEHYVCLSIYDADNRTITLTEVYME